MAQVSRIDPSEIIDLTEREVLTWERFGTATRELALEIANDGYRPDMVLAIAASVAHRRRPRCAYALAGEELLRR